MQMKQLLGCLLIVIVVIVVIWKWQILCEDCVCEKCPPTVTETVCGEGTKPVETTITSTTQETDGMSGTVERDVLECVPAGTPKSCGAGTKESDGISGTVERDVIECEADSPTVCGPGTQAQPATVELDGPSGTVERDGFKCVPVEAGIE